MYVGLLNFGKGVTEKHMVGIENVQHEGRTIQILLRVIMIAC